MPDKTDQVLPLDAGVRLLDDDIALVTDRLGRVTWCNDEAERVFGIAGQEMVGLPFSVVCGGLSGTGRIDVEAVLAGRDFAGGVDCVHKSGKRIDLYAFAAAGRDESGAVAGVVFIARDVTGYARAEEALRTSEEKYRRLFEQSNDIVLVTDQAGRIEEANLAAAHLTGYTADELRERTLSDLVPPDGRRAVDLAFAQVRERGATMSVFTVLTRTGKPITLEASTSLIRVDAGQRALLIGRDITERQLAEQRVRESEHRYRRIFEASGDAVMVLTFNFGIKDTNERACELFGLSRTELLAQSLGDLVAPEDKDWLPLLHERLVRSGQHRSDVRMLGPNGPLGRAQRTVEMTVSLLDLAGGPVVLCVGHDVSERRRAEVALAESEEQYRTALDSMVAAAHVVDRDFRLLVVNKAYREWYARLGLPTPAAGVGLAETAPFLGERVFDGYRRVFDTGQPLVTEEQTEIAGRTFFTETRKTPVIESGKVVRVLTVIYDVTERVVAGQQQRALAEAATGFVRLVPDEDLFGYIADQLCRLLPGVIFSLNRYDEATSTIEVRRVAGLTGEAAGLVQAALGGPIEGMRLAGVPAEVVRNLISGTANTVSSGLYGAFFGMVPEPKCRQLEAALGVTGVHSLGLRRDDRLYGNFTLVLRGDQTLPASLVETFAGQASIAIERSLAEQAQAESEKRYRAIFDKAAEGVFLETLDGGILDANDNACRMTGFSREELQSMRVADLVPPESGSLDGVERALKETGEYRAQTFNRRRDGTVFPVEVAISLLQLSSGPAVLALVRDMTEQKRVTDELADREARLNLLVQQVPTVIWTVDRELVYTSSQGTGLHKLGLRPNQVVGIPLSQYFKSDDPDFPPIAAHRRALAGESARYEFEWVGETFVTALEPLRDAAGAIIGVVGLATDVTGERRAAAELKASEERYRLLFEGTTDSVAIADINGRVLDANPACLMMYGYTAQEVRRMNLADVVAPQSRADAVKAMADLAAGKTVAKAIRMLRRDGSEFVVDLLAYVASVGGEQRIFSFTRDVTERYAAEAARRESEERYRSLADASPDAIYIVDREGAVRYCNAAGTVALGRAGENLVGRSVRELFPPEIAERQAGNIAKVFETGETVHIEGPSRYGERTVWLATWLVGLRDEAGNVREVMGISRDLTERKQAEDEQRETGARYRAIFETTAAATMIIEADTTVLLANRELGRMLGYPSREVVGRSWTEFVVPEDLPRMRSYHDLRRSSDPVTAPRTYEARLVDKQGVIHDCLLTVDMIPGTGRSVASVLDITDRKRVEADLRESDRRLRSLFQTVPVGIYRTTPEGRILMANPALVEMLGFDSLNGLLARNIEEGSFGPGESRAVFKAALEAAGELRGYESSWLRADGQTIVVRESARLVRDADGRVACYEGTVEDVTAQKAAERARREGEQNFSALAANSSDGIGITIGKSGRFGYVNQRVSEMTGYSGTELLEMSFLDVVAPECREPMLARLRSRLAGGIEPRTYETTVLRRDGARVPVELSVSVTTWHGESATVASVRDISERKAAAAALRRSEESYRSALDAMIDPATVVDANLTLLIANRAMRDWLGRLGLEPDIIGKPLRVVFPFLPASVEDEYRRVFATGEPLATTETSEVGGESQTTETTKTPIFEDGGVARVLTVVHDVTEHRAAEVALRESEQRYRRLIEASPDAVVVYQDGVVVLANMAAARVLGYDSVDAIVGYPAAGFVNPEDLAAVAEREAGLGEQRPGVTVEPLLVRYRRRDGGWVNAAVVGAATLWQGRPAIQVTARDVTERERILAELSAARGRYESLLSSVRDGVVTFDLSGRITWANDIVIQLSGLPLDFWLGKHFTEFLPPEQQQVYAAKFEAVVLRGEEVAPYEFSTQLPGGPLFCLEANPSAIREGGVITGGMLALRDITERRRAEQAVRESEAKYRSVVERASDGICIIQEGRLKYLNRRLAEMAGYAQDELVGKRFDEYVHPDDREIVVDRYRRRLAGEELPATYTVRFLVRGGGTATMEINAAVAEFEGAPADIVLVRDVGERERILGELIAARARYESLLQSVRDGVLTVDTEGRVTWVNDVVVQRSGHTREWWFGRQYLETITPDQHDRLKRLFAAVMRGEEIDSYEVVYPWSDGRTVYIEGTAAAIREGDAITGMVVVNRDVSARADTERRLQDSEERYRRLVDLSPDMIAVHQRGLVVYANPATARALGYASSDELLGRPVIELLYPEDRPAVIARMRQVAEGGAPAPPNIERFVAKDGSPVRVEARAAPFLWKGEPATLVVVRNLADAELIAHVSGSAAAAGDALDRAPHGIAAVLNGHIVHVSQRFVELFGYASAGELAGLPAEELLDPVRRAEAHKDLLAAAQGTEPGFCLVLARDRAGKTAELEMAIVGYQGIGFEYSLWFARRPGKAAKKPAAKPRSSGRKAPKTGKRRKP